MNEKIDFVIPWVDGNDIKWQKEKNKYSSSKIDYSNCDSRFRDWGIFKYWFRSIEQNAPWVNNIYFVTYGHLPDFLDTSNPKLKIINHKDFIPKEYLPTFSSHTIELNLHRIEGLSDNFVYFNDDVFIINPVKEEDYFKNGKPVSSYYETNILPFNNSISEISFNNVAILNEIFNKREIYKNSFTKYINFKYGFSKTIQTLLMYPYPSFSNFGVMHGSSSMTKDAYNFMWNNYYYVLHKTCLNKFRHYDTDVNQWLIKDYQNLTGEFYNRKYKFQKLVNITNEDSIIKVKKLINKKSTKELCINDDLNDIENINLYIEKINEILEEKFPNKSSFEK